MKDLVITKDYLTPNEYSRPQKPIREVKAIVMHWTANPGASAKANRDFFERRKIGTMGYGSAHYIVDTDGTVIAAIPETEIAYHVGSSRPDPKSGEIYTDLARKKFDHYAKHYKLTSPNYCTLGIELCPLDDDGNFTDATIVTAIKLCAALCSRYNLTTDDVVTHNQVVGWKDCPRLWVRKPYLFDAFKESVREEIERRKNNAR